jgi:hypothetical protein
VNLTEWLERSTVAPHYHLGGAVSVPDVITNQPIRRWLWQLDDYRVSSIIGGSVWLVPIKGGTHANG